MEYEDPLADFDLSKPFYSLVLNFLIQIAGFQSLYLRGSGTVFGDLFREVWQFQDPGDSFRFDAMPGLDAAETAWIELVPANIPVEHARRIMESRHEITKLLSHDRSDALDSIRLSSRTRSCPLLISLGNLVRRVPAGERPLVEESIRSSGSLLILAFETAKERGDYNKSEPLWEFLRHCRNAAAHGGRFHFHPGEPKRDAAWGPLKIEGSLEGTSLIAVEEADGFLGRADPILLLRDIEWTYYRTRPAT